MEELSLLLSKREARRPLKWPWKRKHLTNITTTAVSSLPTGLTKIAHPLTTTATPSTWISSNTAKSATTYPPLLTPSITSHISKQSANDISRLPSSDIDYIETNDIWWNQEALWEERDVTANISIPSIPTSWNVTLGDKNFTGGHEIKEQEGSGEMLIMVVTAFILGLIILATVIGEFIYGIYLFL